MGGGKPSTGLLAQDCAGELREGARRSGPLDSIPGAAGTGPSACERRRLQTSGPLTTANGVFQIGKLRSELEMVSGNVRVMSEMLTELVPTQAEPADLELLQVSAHRPQATCSSAHTPPFPTHTTVFRPPLHSLVTVGDVKTRDFGLQIRLEFRVPQLSGLNTISPLPRFPYL